MTPLAGVQIHIGLLTGIKETMTVGDWTNSQERADLSRQTTAQQGQVMEIDKKTIIDSRDWNNNATQHDTINIW
jgi:hypothetical protein